MSSAYKGPQRDRTRARVDARSRAFEDGVARRLEDGLTDAMARDMTCWDCGHATGDHRAIRRPMPLANVFGVCLVDGCGCESFAGAPG